MTVYESNYNMETNRLRTEDKVEVMLVHSDGRKEQYEGTGFRDIEQAILAAAEALGADDCDTDVFKVTDLATGITSSYRINAHGHVKLIV